MVKIILHLYCLLLIIVSCSKSNLKFYEYNDFIFGSYLRIKITADDSVQIRRAIAKTLQTLHHIDTVASIFNPQSEVSQINKIGYGQMSKDLKALIVKSIEVSEKSDGAFDVTVGPVMKTLWFLDTIQNSKFRIQNSENLIGYKKIRIKGDSIFLKPKMMIDLGGLAVGYALDEAYNVLKAEGIKDCLIDAGGDIICFGNKSYKIGIKNPIGEGIIKTITVKNQAISTSGNYEKFFEKDDKKFCHIINPKTGKAISDTSGSLCSVTIIADKCVDADAYATAVFVLGIKDGQNLIRKLGYKGILITNDGKMIEVK